MSARNIFYPSGFSDVIILLSLSLSLSHTRTHRDTHRHYIMLKRIIGFCVLAAPLRTHTTGTPAGQSEKGRTQEPNTITSSPPPRPPRTERRRGATHSMTHRLP